MTTDDYDAQLKMFQARMAAATSNPLDALIALAELMDFTADEAEYTRPNVIREAVSALRD